MSVGGKTNKKRISMNKRIGHKKKLFNEVYDESSKYKMSFRRLSMKERLIRTDSLAKLVLSTCVDRVEMKTIGKTYFDRNKELAVDVLTLLEYLRHRIQYKLKLNLRQYEKDFTPLNEVEDEVRDMENSLQPTSDERDFQTAVAMLGEHSRNGYKRVRDSILAEFKSITPDDIPSFHDMTKDRPKVEPLLYEPLPNLCSAITVDVNETAEGTTNEEIVTPSYVIPDEDDAAKAEGLRDDNKIVGAKLVGSYESVIKLLIQKAKDDNIPLTGDLLVIDSFDGAEHLKTKKKKISFVSFSTQITCKSAIESGRSTSASFGILTWMQIQGDEKRETLFPVLMSLYEEKEKLRQNPLYSKYRFVDLHDLKMTYGLTQHSLWNRKVHNMLLCKCTKGEGVRKNRDANFKCTRLTHDEQIKYWDRSILRMQRKIDRVDKNAYTTKQHRDWADEHNLGVTHFGIYPGKLRRDCIAFYVMHMGHSMTRSTMTCTRTFVISQSTEFIDVFNNNLYTFWGKYHVTVWNHNKPFSSFHGNELHVWIKNIPKTIAILREHFELTPHVVHICLLLETYSKIVPFLHITKIGNPDGYPKLIDEYENNMTILYDVGAKTVLTNNNEGDAETIYMHVARYYIPKLARELFEKYGVGIGIMNMQGYERRNKESKNIVRRFSNHRGNLVIPNLKRLWDVFKHSKTAV
jgi:hypothetical protein